VVWWSGTHAVPTHEPADGPQVRAMSGVPDEFGAPVWGTWT
jgi:hypothetical protein